MLTEFVESELQTHFSEYKNAGAQAQKFNLIATAGTPTTLSALVQNLKNYDASKVHTSVISRDQLETQTARLAKMSMADRCKLPCLPEKRADVIVAGLLILKVVATYFNFDRIHVSDRGLRFGVLENFILKK